MVYMRSDNWASYTPDLWCAELVQTYREVCVYVLVLFAKDKHTGPSQRPTGPPGIAGTVHYLIPWQSIVFPLLNHN